MQGGIFNDLRKQSLDQLIEINFDGYALGGLAVGESQQEMFDVLDYISPFLPREKAHYLTNREEYKTDKKILNSKDVIHVKLAAGGGACLIITQK